MDSWVWRTGAEAEHGRTWVQPTSVAPTLLPYENSPAPMIRFPTTTLQLLCFSDQSRG